MKEQDSERQMLREAYEAHFLTDDELLRNPYFPPQTHATGDGTILVNPSNEILHHLVKQELMSGWGVPSSYKITGSGILYCEEKELVPMNMSKHNIRGKLDILKALIILYDDNIDKPLVPRNKDEEDWFKRYPEASKRTNVQVVELAEFMNRPAPQLIPHLTVLTALHYIEDWAPGNQYVPTPRGRQVKSYEDISNLAPHQRGKQFESLIATEASLNGFTQEAGIRNTNEENDVIIYRGNDFYLIECKWWNKAIETRYVRDLYSKLSERVRVIGLFFSMSGFSPGAVEYAEKNSNQHQILLFGPRDIEALVYGRVSLDNLLEAKLKELVMRRHVKYS